MFKINKFDLLVSIYIFCVVASELMGGKTFHLFNIGSYQLNASVAIFLIPLVYAASDIITEVFGKARAQSVVRSGIIMIFFLILFSFLATILPPSSRFLPTEPAYETIFKISIRISIASLIAFAVGELTDILIFAKMREKLGSRALWLRTNVANIISEFFDTTIFIMLAFYTLGQSFGGNMIFLSGIILPYWILKCFMSVIETPFVYLGVKWLQRSGVAERRESGGLRL